MAATPSFDERERYVRELAALIEIPSVSLDPGRRDDVRRAAEWVAGQLAFARGRVVETAGHPAVLAEWLGAPEAPTILVYGHYDVQPPGDESAWTTPPFAPSVRDGRIYGRGATDDKGPVVVALETAKALFAANASLPLNVRFLIEGEEEIGSPSLPAFLRERREELACDLVVSADGAMWRPGEPSVSIAAKGLVALDVIVRGPREDLHSGRHGGAVQNPNHALARIVASLHHPDGAVAVAGFYDDVVPLAEADRDALGHIPFDEVAYQQDLGVPALHGEPGYSTLERVWTRPTLEVNELRGGGAFTVIPGEARAHVTCRLVPNQDPERIFRAVQEHVALHVPQGVSVRVVAQPGGVRAYSIGADHPAVLAAVRALQVVYPADEPLLVRIGGTLPAAVVFEQVLGVKTLLFSFSTADEQLHAPNEFFRLDRLEEGMAAWVELWRLLSEALIPSREEPA
jgi:acetylornithine deacetylase/succinyl-diaminopimelate desuccinylase-like protein